jgi:hypothetical protein
MGFIAALRQAEDKAAAVALNEKRQDQDLETAMRRRMRVHPQPAGAEKTELRPSSEGQPLRPIVSIHGRDVKDDEVDPSAA